MRSKEEIERLLQTGGLNPEARKIFETQLAIIKEEEEKKESESRKRKDSLRFWMGFGVATAIAIASLIVAIIAIMR